MIPIAPMNGMDIVVLVSALIFFVIVFRYLSTLLRSLLILAIGLVICVSLADITSRTLDKYGPDTTHPHTKSEGLVDVPSLSLFQTFMGEQ